MNPLAIGDRTRLADVIQQARRVAETGAANALESLAVNQPAPFEWQSPAEKSLRNRLRSRGRQAGDRRDPATGAQPVARLAREVAFEHWHRMLFARFLAENGLLRHPEHKVELTLKDCRELADEEGVNRWEYAARCAEHMLPEIFGGNDPALALTLFPETRQGLQALLDDLPPEVFGASDSLGWTYQFWQAEKKDEVNASGAKIGADELPAVTQLFTERYMVLFLLHNTIGAWRAGMILDERAELAGAAAGERELRRSARVKDEAGGGYDFEYLRFVRDPRAGETDGDRTGPWRPAAGTFPKWPRKAADLRVLDPCCGSGHFLIEAFDLLARLRMEEEGLSGADAARAVLRDNLFGLEIDPRCAQIAAFNLAMAAWRLAGGYVELPKLSVACAGLAPNASEEEWRAVADRVGGETESESDGRLHQGMAALHALFDRAPELGSLVDPASVKGDLFRADFGEVADLLKEAIGREHGANGRDERAVAAAGMAEAAQILQGRYTLVATNVPFLARGRQAPTLRKFAAASHGDAKGDIATVFVSRIFEWLGGNGTQAVVMPQNWLFLKTYRKLRERLLKERTWNLVARLGPGAFETVTGHVVQATLGVLSASRPGQAHQMTGVTVAATCGHRELAAHEKARCLSGEGAEVRPEHHHDDSWRRVPGVLFQIRQEHLRTANHVVVLDPGTTGKSRVGQYARAWQGIVTGDDRRFTRRHWELADTGAWVGLQRAPNIRAHFSGRDTLIHWDGGDGELHGSASAHNFPPSHVMGKHGIAVQQMSGLMTTLFTGNVFGPTVAPLIPHTASELPALWSFCHSSLFCDAVRSVNPKINVTPGSFGDVPFDLDHWRRVAVERYPNGLPEPYSDDPTQWIFHGHPSRSVVWNEEARSVCEGPLRTESTVLQIAMARLVGYRWPAELDPDMRLAPEQRRIADDCRAFDRLADRDGIVCLPPVNREINAVDRLRAILIEAYGDQWSHLTERRLLAATRPSNPPRSLHHWLRDRFFEEHCKLFHNRPFIWHVWDGRKDGFHAFVNCHRLTGPNLQAHQVLQALIWAYLGDWIRTQGIEQEQGVPGAGARLAAAVNLQEQLERILEGDPPCDVFVRWRPLHEQAIGWEPDVNDGVRMNIRPFMRAKLAAGGRKGAGILRFKPNIKWNKDVGKEPIRDLRPRDEFPWFWNGPGRRSKAEQVDYRAGPDAEFDGNRWNDLHYSRAVKKAARDPKAGGER